MTDEMLSRISFSFFLSYRHPFFMSLNECIIHQKKKLIKRQSSSRLRTLRTANAPSVVVFTCSHLLITYSRSLIFAISSCTGAPPLCHHHAQRGRICDLISPGDIKEKPCFIHRHKAPEFAQIKFARLCLRAWARGLTPIEMTRFLTLMKEKGGTENVTSHWRGCMRRRKKMHF